MLARGGAARSRRISPKATLALDAAIWREARRELDTQAGLAFYFVNRRRRSKDACARAGALRLACCSSGRPRTSVVSSGSFNLPQKCLSQGVNCFLSFDSPPSPLGISVDSSRPVSANSGHTSGDEWVEATRSDVDLLVCRSAGAAGHVPQPTHYPTKPCETRPWTSAGGSRNLGLGKYEAAFRDNANRRTSLRHLTAEDLQGDRRRGRRRSPQTASCDRGVGRPVALGGASLAAQCGRAASAHKLSWGR